MGQALYRAYRPKSLSEVSGQEPITTALSRSLQNGTISHAYLFTGIRGTGKTSIARIFAHEINGLPYEDESTHLDIIEIDAASNRRIDEIRDLRDKVHIAPTSAKYKVYIIDEVHMLTREAFNALLKTLEEPPAHVVFILATTEVHKLPETIISRTQRFAFKPYDLSTVTAHLKFIAEQEKITITDEALELIAEHGEGSFRDSISLLDQVRNTGEKITLADVQTVLGIAPKELIAQIIQALSSHDPVALSKGLTALSDGGHEASQAAKQLGTALRESLLAGKSALGHDILMQLLPRLIEVPGSADPKSYLEVALLDAALSDAGAKITPTKVMHEAVQAKPAVQVEPHPSTFRKTEHHIPKSPTDTPAKKGTAAPLLESVDSPASIPSDSAITLDASVWPTILAAVKAKHNTLYSIVRATSPAFTPGNLTLTCGFAFHQKRLNEKRNKQMLGELIQQTTGENLQITCVVGEVGPLPEPTGPPPLPPADQEVSHSVTRTPAATPPPAAQNEAITAISNIFGGAEVLES